MVVMSTEESRTSSSPYMYGWQGKPNSALEFFNQLMLANS